MGKNRAEEIGQKVIDAIGKGHMLKRINPSEEGWICECMACGVKDIVEDDKTTCEFAPTDADVDAFLRHGPSLGY